MNNAEHSSEGGPEGNRPPPDFESLSFDTRPIDREHPAMTQPHPLAMLAGAEITRASEAVRTDPRFPAAATFVHVVLHEPDKAELVLQRIRCGIHDRSWSRREEVAEGG